MKSWGKFTSRGSSDVESRITTIIEETVAVLAEILSPRDYLSLIMIGGYGRGEGGVEVKNGVELPHNNFDLLLITADMNIERQQQLKQQLDAGLQKLIAKHNIGIDIGMIAASKLRSAPCLVMWHDMYYGHKTLLGDDKFIPSLTQFTKPPIASDVRNLLVNRGTLLVINEFLLDSKPQQEEIQRLVIKHAVKAVIGYGDALLYFLGQYSWSYEEKQRRMQQQKVVPQEFRNLYHEMLEFRFQPLYTEYLNRDLVQWLQQLGDLLSPIHLECERLRLKNSTMTWDNYPNVAFAHAFWENFWSPRATAKKLVYFLRTPNHPLPAPIFSKWGFRCLGWQGILPVLFPVVAYHLTAPSFRDLYCQALNVQEKNLVQAYLKKWSEVGDINFHNFLQRYQLEL